MTTDNGGHAGGPPAGTNDSAKLDSTSAALADVTARLQAHSESLRRDIHRLQKALSDIDGAMSTSLNNVDRMRASTEKLRQVFGPQTHAKKPPAKPQSRALTGADAAPKPPLADKRCGSDRRTGLDRRRMSAEVSGLLRWIEGTSLDRRRNTERRRLSDRRLSEPGMLALRLSPRQSVSEHATAAAQTNNIVSLAAVRANRRREARRKK